MPTSKIKICLVTRQGSNWNQSSTIVASMSVEVELPSVQAFWNWEAAWDEEACKTSMKVNGLYEASGLALWLRSGIYSIGSGFDLDPGSVACKSIESFKNDFFSKESAMKAVTRRGAAKKQRQKSRLLWPSTMVCGCPNVADVEKPKVDGIFNLSGGHFILWSWYLALFEALTKKVPCLRIFALMMSLITFYFVDCWEPFWLPFTVSPEKKTINN